MPITMDNISVRSMREEGPSGIRRSMPMLRWLVEVSLGGRPVKRHYVPTRDLANAYAAGVVAGSSGVAKSANPYAPLPTPPENSFRMRGDIERSNVRSRTWDDGWGFGLSRP